MADDEYPELEKAAEFVDDCEQAGWDCDWEEIEDDIEQCVITSVQAQRGDEEVNLRWHGKRYDSGEYSHDGNTYRPVHNVGAARKLLEAEGPVAPKRRGRPPKPTVEEDGYDASIRILPRKLPFDIEAALDEEIIGAVRGKTLIWWNTQTLDYDRAQVLPARQRNIYMEESSKGRVILTFVSPEGFRSVALDTLVQVR